MVSSENRPFFCGETKMTTDPKNDEIKSEDLEGIAGGAGGDNVDDEQPDGGGSGSGSGGSGTSTPGKGGREGA
jgi:hypothetical protein